MKVAKQDKHNADETNKSIKIIHNTKTSPGTTLSMSVFGHLRRLWIGEDSLKGDDIVGCFIFGYLFFILISSMHPSPLVPRQTWGLTGCY